MCVQKVAGASPHRWRQCVKEDPPWSMGQCLVFLCYPPITRPAACGRSRRTSSSSGTAQEERVGEGTPCKSRKTVTLILFFCVGFLYFLVNRRTLQVRLVHLTVALWTAPLVNLARHTLFFRCRVLVVQ